MLQLRQRLSILCAFGALLLFSHDIWAATEYVTVVKVLKDDDKGIIQRKNGERWLIEKGTGALSFWRYEGKRVLIYSPGLFCGLGSKVILPDNDQEARIWNAEKLADESEPAPSRREVVATSQNDSIKAATLALVNLKFLDPKSDDKDKGDLVHALKRFQTENNLDEAGRVGPRTLAKMAELVLRDKGSTAEGLELAQALVESARQMRGELSSRTTTMRRPTGSNETFITDVKGDGAIVKLADGSIYEVDEIDRIDTMLWLPTDNVLKRPDGLLNLNNGESVKATLLK